MARSRPGPPGALRRQGYRRASARGHRASDMPGGGWHRRSGWAERADKRGRGSQLSAGLQLLGSRCSRANCFRKSQPVLCPIQQQQQQASWCQPRTLPGTGHSPPGRCSRCCVTHGTEAELVQFPCCSFHSLNGDRRGRGGWKWPFKQAPRTCRVTEWEPTAQVCCKRPVPHLPAVPWAAVMSSVAFRGHGWMRLRWQTGPPWTSLPPTASCAQAQTLARPHRAPENPVLPSTVLLAGPQPPARCPSPHRDPPASLLKYSLFLMH